MKKLMIMAVSLLTVNASLFAGISTVNPGTGHKATAAAKPPFHSIVINNDIDVVLTEATDNMIEVKGAAAGINMVNYYIKKGVLYISSRQGSLKGRATVYLSVNGLKNIEINGSSYLTSNGFLNSRRLNVVVRDEAKFELKNRGEILIEADSDIELHVKK
jgi:Putative auto-transporter adhesin, head GIN domain